jgi:hypothetical protein
LREELVLIRSGSDQAGELLGGVSEPFGVWECVRSERFEGAFLGVMEQCAVQAEGGGFGGIDQAGGVAGAHLEQDAEFEFAECTSSEEPAGIVVGIARCEHMESGGGAFGEDLVELLAGVEGGGGGAEGEGEILFKPEGAEAFEVMDEEVDGRGGGSDGWV